MPTSPQVVFVAKQLRSLGVSLRETSTLLELQGFLSPSGKPFHPLQISRLLREQPKVIDGLLPRSCARCDRLFTPTAYQSRFCCSTYWKRANDDAKKYAVRKGAIIVETVDVFTVFERDRWTCQLCGKPTPRGQRGMMLSDAPELDHIIPISKGGTHTYGNVRLSCRACNGSFTWNSLSSGVHGTRRRR